MKRVLLQVAATAVLTARLAQGEIRVLAERSEMPVDAGGSKPVAAKTPASATDVDTDILTFLNGDRMHGSLVSAEPEGFGFKWKSSVMASPAAFSLAQLDRARFGRRSAAVASTPQCQVRLSNDDTLRGELVALEGEAMVLRTSYAGDLSLRRAMISQIWPGKGLAGVVYEGPEDMEGWVVGNNARARDSWALKDGYLISLSPASIGRNIAELPDAAEIQFELSTSGPYLQMNVGFCAENLQAVGGGNMYFLQFGGRAGYLYRCTNNGNSRRLGQNFQLSSERNTPVRKATVRIFLNRSKNQIALVLNGQLIQQWTDPDGFPGAGKGLIFHCQDGMRYKIGNIRVAAWDGRIPQGGDAGDSVASTDTMLLANGDKISGKVTAIKGGAVKFETSYAPLDVPMDRITEISFGKEGRQKARLNKNDVQCQFTGGGTLTFDLITLDNGQISGKSENFGDITLALSALEGIRFNPWSRPIEDSNEGLQAEPDGDGIFEIDE